jgi:hypothetical protein
MFAILATKSLQTSVLAALLFYVFANPGMYKIIRQFPGLKFVMKSATEITHAGTMVNAVLFGLVMLLCVHLINSALIKDHLKFLNVVENFENNGGRLCGDPMHGSPAGAARQPNYWCHKGGGGTVNCNDIQGSCTPWDKKIWGEEANEMGKLCNQNTFMFLSGSGKGDHNTAAKYCRCSLQKAGTKATCDSAPRTQN